MSMRSKGMMMAAMQLALVSEILSSNSTKVIIDPNYNSEADKNRIERLNKERLMKRGVKYFTIDGFTVMARDEKNAIRKVERLKAQNKLIV